MVKEMMRQDIKIKESNLLVMGLTFKENCPDLRNTRVIDVIAELKDYGVNVDVYDPWADADEAKAHYGIDLLGDLKGREYDGLVLAVAHNEFKLSGEALGQIKKDNCVVYDLKNVLERELSDLRL